MYYFYRELFSNYFNQAFHSFWQIKQKISQRAATLNNPLLLITHLAVEHSSWGDSEQQGRDFKSNMESEVCLKIILLT